MNLPADALARMSTNQRKHWERLLVGGVVPDDMMTEAEQAMNEQGLGWCRKHHEWHTIGITGYKFVAPFEACERQFPPFPLRMWDIEELDCGDPPEKAQAFLRQRQEAQKREIYAQGPQAFRDYIDRDSDLQKAIRAQQDADRQRRQQDLLQQMEAYEEFRQQREAERRADIAEIMGGGQQQQKKKSKPKTWLFKVYNKCPDCGIEMVTPQWKDASQYPEPVDAADKIDYTEEPCGCQLIGIKDSDKQYVDPSPYDLNYKPRYQKKRGFR